MTQKQIDRVLQFFRNEEYKDGDFSVWTIEAWAIGQRNITAGSAVRHCRTLVLSKDLEHPVIDGKVNKHYFRLTEQGRNREISATGKSDKETPGEQMIVSKNVRLDRSPSGVSQMELKI